jgi:2-polyprenyl-3-methyl-5-hydroxy-6-metoxy-1,4-benzoquinol methylase
MIPFSSDFSHKEEIGQKTIYFFDAIQKNIDAKTVDSFGEEWEHFNTFTDEEITIAGDQYFDIIDKTWLEGKTALDVGCGSGRWTKYVAQYAHFVEAIDPSKAVYSSAQLLQEVPNTRISNAGVDNIPFEDHSFDFVFSLGVLHHIPDTQLAMQQCVAKLKPQGKFLVYLYYNFEQRGLLFKAVFMLSNLIRLWISKMPSFLKKVCCDFIALLVYLPLVFLSKCIEKIGLKKISNQIPLSYYKSHSFYIMRNDALDRFGTPLEQRFSRAEITEMMQKCGLKNIIISENEPFWHAVGEK